MKEYCGSGKSCLITTLIFSTMTREAKDNRTFDVCGSTASIEETSRSHSKFLFYVLESNICLQLLVANSIRTNFSHLFSVFLTNLHIFSKVPLNVVAFNHILNVVEELEHLVQAVCCHKEHVCVSCVKAPSETLNLWS